MTTPKVGQWLHASCSDEYYGQIVAVGTDENDTPTIDIRLEDPDDLAGVDGEREGWQMSLTTIEVPEGVKLILRNVQWKATDSANGAEKIVCNTPGRGCYRCTSLFTLNDHPYEDRFKAYKLD